MQFPLTWDNSMRTTFKTCPRKFYFFMQGFDYASRPSYFIWGEAWHEILRKWHSFEKLDPSDASYWENVERSIQAGFSVWDAEAPEEKGDNRRESLATIFRAYVQTYSVEPWTLVELGAETGWEWPIKGTPYYLGGSLDARIEWESYGTLPREDKSDGNYLSDGVVTQWYHSPQIKNYVWYENQITGGDSCLVNIATKKIPGPRSQWTTPRFYRIVARFSQSDLEEHLEDTLFDIEQARSLHWENEYWPKTSDPKNCVGGTGKAPCLFKDFCTARVGKNTWKTEDLTRFSIHIKRREEAWEPWKRKGGV